MREEEKESLALEAAVAEGRIREEAVVLKAAMDMVVGAGVDGDSDSDSVRLSDIRSAIWKWNGFDSSFYSLLLFRIGFGWPNINIHIFIYNAQWYAVNTRWTGLVWKWDWVCLLVYCCPRSLHPTHDPSISIKKVGFCFYCFFYYSFHYHYFVTCEWAFG